MLNCVELKTNNISTTKPRYEVADIFRLYGAEYKNHYPVTFEQEMVMRDIVSCRTAVMGGHVDACNQCGGLRISYNSCRNRHCPKCGSLVKAEWVEKQKAHLLPVHYFHVVFTLDHALLPLMRSQRKKVYDLLFQAAATSLKSFGQRYLGGEIGFVAVLHSWGQTLQEHPHLHCLVTGGALVAGQHWRATSPHFLFPIEALSAEFRERFCLGLGKLYAAGELVLDREAAEMATRAGFAQLLSQVREKKWQVYAKPPFGDANQVLEYLGRYTQRIAISNHRLLDIADGQVQFSYRDYKAGGQRKQMSLAAVEFIRRFLCHVLPKNFVRIRSYGLLAARYRQQKLVCCRALLLATGGQPPPMTREAILMAMLGRHPDQCPMCETGHFQRQQTIPPHPTRRRWLQAVQG